MTTEHSELRLGKTQEFVDAYSAMIRVYYHLQLSGYEVETPLERIKRIKEENSDCDGIPED